MLNLMWVQRYYAPKSTLPMHVVTKAKGNASYMWFTKIKWNLKSTQKYTTWTDRVVRKYDLYKKAPSWKIFIIWYQTGTGGEDMLGNMVQTNASNVNTRGLSSGKFTIDLQGKQMGWVMGPQSWPLQWRKRAQPGTISRQTDLSTGEKSTAGRRRRS